MKQNNQFIHSTLITAVTLIFLFSSNLASAINKCTINGQVSYSDLPCPEQAHSSEFTQQIIPPNDPAAAKKRHLADKEKLHQLNQKKKKEENKYQREMQALARHIKKEKNHEFRCRELDLERKAAHRHQFEMQGKRNSYARERARLRVKQADNKYVHVCKS